MVTDVDLETAARDWREDGWTLIDGLVPTDDVDRALVEIDHLEIPRPTGPTRRADVAATEPRFRAAQFDGTTLFPLPSAPDLNRLFIHPRIVSFAELAMGTDDLRIYQSRLWSKHGDHTDYEQPLHRDQNHALVPTRSEPGFWHLECFLYITDVDETNGAPRLVPRSRSHGEPPARGPVHRADQPQLYAAEVSAPGRRGSLLAYRSDVWHRGTDVQPGRERHVAVIAFKPAGTDWIGFDAHPPLVNSPDFRRFAEACTPDELALFGVPRPGHPFWTDRTVTQMGDIYPDLDLAPWRAAL